MICTGKFVYKSITLRAGGSFTDDKGNPINYPDAYILKVDEILDNGDINERKFKIDKNKTILVNRFKELKPYDDINLKFEITLFATKCGIEVIDFTDYDEN